MSEFFSMLKDPNYLRGFVIRGLGDAVTSTGPIGEERFGQSEEPVWNLCQWSARYSFTDKTVSTFSSPKKGVYDFKSPTNNFIVDTVNRSLIFDCTASKCYDAPRTENQGWQHLLIEAGFTQQVNKDPKELKSGDSRTKATELKRINVKGNISLTKFEDHMGSDFNPDLHAAQFLLYFTVHNCNPESKDFKKMIWLGINFFDNRHEFQCGGSQYDKGTDCLIVGLGNCLVYPSGDSFFKNGKPVASEKSYDFNVNILSHVKKALATANKDGYLLNTNFEDLNITGMNIGWEVPGTFDVTMKLNNFDVVAELL